jgi:hypothetical protein
MKFYIPFSAKPDIRIHKTYEFLEDFYVNKYPKYRSIWIFTTIILIGTLTCLLLK